jgi:hypothetical protein
MKKRNPCYRYLPLLLLLIFSLKSCSEAPSKLQHFELKVYHISDETQEQRVDNYLKDVYLPALHRAGIPKIGVFKPVEGDTTSGGKIYVFIPFKNADQYIGLPDLLLKDKTFITAGASFVSADYANPPYNRLESILMKAFSNMPAFAAPEHSTPPEERIYELRSYESPTEAFAVKKIEMFNEAGEMALFESLGFKAVFYGEVLAGNQMPNLMYMTTFSDMKSRDEHWSAFRESPEWKRMLALEEYKNTVSKIHIYLTHPASYSDF